MIERGVMMAVDRLVEGFGPRAIILFGSRARGTADDRSDFDLIVVCDEVKDRNEMILAMHRAMRGLKIGCDIILLTPEEFEIEKQMPGSVVRQGMKEGRSLYERAA